MNIPDDEMILAFWDRQKNTADIADRYGCREHIIANRLPRLLLARREGKQCADQSSPSPPLAG